ncbi:MAG: hypothetical protein V3T17_19800 [Pseudomonadales bacterium]
MKTSKTLKKQVCKLVLMSFVSAILNSQAAQASEELTLKYGKTIKVMKFSKNLKIRGFEIAQGVYIGQAKVAGKYGFGVVVDKKDFSWGINHRGISILKRF